MNEAASDSIAAPHQTARRRATSVGIALFVTWIAGLTWLVVTTSNPVTLNLAQLLNSDTIVAAELINRETGEFRRVTTLIGDEPPETFRVRMISEVVGPESGRWLLPLQRERENYSIVPVPYRDKELLLVYPADDETIAQARDLLGIE